MATIQGIYVALFGRPADPAGLSFFNGITKNGADLSQIANLSGQSEYLNRFTGFTPTQIINSIYQSLFNRDAEATGLNFWSNKLSTGALTVNNIAIAILDGANGTDKTIVNSKIAAADLFTSHLDTQQEQQAFGGNTVNISLVRDYLKTITDTKLATSSEIDALIARMVASSGQAPTDGQGTGGGGGTSTPVADITPVKVGDKEIVLTKFVQGVDKIDLPNDMLPANPVTTFNFNSVDEVKQFLSIADGTKYGNTNVAYFATAEGKSVWLIDANHDGIIQFGGQNPDTLVIITGNVTPVASDFV